MALRRRDDPESRVYWASVDKIASDWKREKAEPRSKVQLMDENQRLRAALEQVKQVQRYTVYALEHHIHDCVYATCESEPQSEGGWVRWEDIEKAAAHSLRAEAANLQGFIEKRRAT